MWMCRSLLTVDIKILCSPSKWIYRLTNLDVVAYRAVNLNRSFLNSYGEKTHNIYKNGELTCKEVRCNGLDEESNLDIVPLRGPLLISQ